jgi:hypothetical protein
MNNPTTPCATCGMPVTHREYHPYGACLMFKQCNDSQVVRENLRAVQADKNITHIAALQAENVRLREALQFYADGGHFLPLHPEKWESVSGEPENFVEEGMAGSVTVEDGSIAKVALSQPPQRKHREQRNKY